MSTRPPSEALKSGLPMSGFADGAQKNERLTRLKRVSPIGGKEMNLIHLLILQDTASG